MRFDRGENGSRIVLAAIRDGHEGHAVRLHRERHQKADEIRPRAIKIDGVRIDREKNSLGIRPATRRGVRDQDTFGIAGRARGEDCLLYTSDAADE